MKNAKLFALLPILSIAMAVSAGAGRMLSAAASTVTVSVTDASGNPIEGLDVKLQELPTPRPSNAPNAMDPNQNAPKAARKGLPEPKTIDTKKTEKNGKVTFANVPAGRVRVLVPASASYKQKFQIVKIEDGKDATVNLKLEAK